MSIALMAMMIGVRFMFDDADGRTRMSDGQDEPTRWRFTAAFWPGGDGVAM